MVKIINELGEFKTGKQGEAVYQGRYGQQMRRTTHPHWTIYSEKQEQHRQLYRNALAWRKALSLTNRRYLEGYCIANWVVDRYKMPLPWHRFALKIYLEHVKFIPTLSTEKQSGEELLDQQYITGDDSETRVDLDNWAGMTFTPALAGKLTKIEVKLWRGPATPYHVCQIRTTEANGSPSNTILASQNFSGDILETMPPGSFETITFDNPPTLAAETLYAIILRSYPVVPFFWYFWGRDDTDPTYTRGQVWLSTDAGITWTPHSGKDHLFKAYIHTPTTYFTYGTLHIRHPAIKSFTQKRNGIIVRAEDNLSSLDDQYLTKQVGLDVEGGDEIEATTVAGILYKFLL